MTAKRKPAKSKKPIVQDPLVEILSVGNELVTPPVITTNDIETMVAIINIASTRGAFKAPELKRVGGLYDTLVRFLEYFKKSVANDTTNVTNDATKNTDDTATTGTQGEIKNE